VIEQSEHESRFAHWDAAEHRAMRWVPYAALGFSLVCTLFVVNLDTPGRWPGLGPTVALTAVAVAWMAIFTRRMPGHDEWIGWRGVVYYVGMLGLALWLVTRAPWYGFFAWIGYIHGWAFLAGRWRYAAVVATAGIAALSQIGGQVPPTGMGRLGLGALWAFNAVLAVSFTIIAYRSDIQKEVRGRMVTELGETNRKLEATMAENAGLHAQLLSAAREAGVLDERQRLAGEIHDTLAQGLIGIIAQLEAAAAGDSGPDRQRHLDAAATLARDSLAEARRSVAAIAPAPLAAARLPDAMADVAAAWSTLNGVGAEVTTTGTARPLHTDVEVALLRTAQEALSNVARHAGASRVGLTLSYMDGEVTLDVVDDGAGFDPDHLVAGPGGYGLTAMRQRVQRLAGSLAIESEPDAGTAISARLPAVPAAPAVRPEPPAGAATELPNEPTATAPAEATAQPAARPREEPPNEPTATAPAGPSAGPAVRSQPAVAGQEASR
jgi:signal transduction histidine kinase